MTRRFQIFISAVSRELRTARNAVASDLRARGLDVRVQEDFRQEVDTQTTLEKLNAYISGCDAVALPRDAWMVADLRERLRQAGGP